MLRRLFQLDVDQRERLLRRLHLQVGSRSPNLVGQRSLVSDRSYGCRGNRGEATSAVCAHISGVYATSIREPCPSDLYRAQSDQQRLRLREHDLGRVTVGDGHDRDECHCGLYIDTSWR